MKNGEVPGRVVVYKTWWKNRSKLAKRLIIACVISTILLLLILFIYLLLPNESSVCSSKSCVRTSQELLLNYVDLKVNPCEDFYRFSCGNFLQKLDNHGSRTARGVMENAIRARIKNMLEEPPDSNPSAFNLAKKFYRACTNKTAIDSEGLKGMKQIFERIGGWPTLRGYNWREDKYDWKDAVYKLRRMGINNEFFLILSVQRDKADSGRYILNLKDPFAGSAEISDGIKKLYLDYMVDLAMLMGADEKRARIEQQEVMQFLLDLAKISEEAAFSNETRDYNLYSLSELQSEFPEIGWHEFIPRIFEPVPFSPDYEINVTKPQYIRKLVKLLKKTKNRTVANFVCWYVLQQLINYLPEKILNRAYEYLVKVDRNATRISRWDICLDDVESRLPTVISAAYVKKYLDEETRSRIISMIRNIKYQFKENLQELDWLDAKTKAMAVAILVSSVEDIPSYNNLIEENRFYKEVEIFEDKLLTLVLNLDYVATNIRYEKLQQPANENFFEKLRSVTGLNIVYSPKENILRIPVGLFQGIFYQKSRPEYMNYGALGTLVAHEIYHIMTEAKYRNSEEKLTSWWSSHSLLNYEQKRHCLSSHYGQYVLSKIEQHANGSSTQDEDMADLAGMKTAYDTYTSWAQFNGIEPALPELQFSPSQLFWISSAVPHCAEESSPNYKQEKMRVNGILQNLREFSRDFGCSREMKMNPESKCRIW